MRRSAPTRAHHRAAARTGMLLAALVAVVAVALSGCTFARPFAQGPYPTAGGRLYYLDGSLTKSTRHPLVVVLSGINAGPADVEQQTGWAPFGASHGVTVAFGVPAGNGWNAGGCCGAAAIANADDVSYLTAVVDDVSKRLPIDRTRVYIVGFSTGGMMAERAACERPDVFAAAGSVSGALLVPCPSGARIVHVHGQLDAMVPPHGGFPWWVNFTFPDIGLEKGKILTGHPDAAYNLIMLPKVGHWWPTLHDGFDATSRLWVRLAPYHR